MTRGKSEFKHRKNFPIKNKKQSKIVKPQKIKSNPKKFVKLASESIQSQVKAAAVNQGIKSLGVKRKQQDVDNGVKKFKNNKDQAILRVHNSNNIIQKDSPLKLIKSSGSLKQDNLKNQSLDVKKKSVVKMGKVETAEQNTDIKKIDIKSSHCSESIEKIPSTNQATGYQKRKNEIWENNLKQKLGNTKKASTRPNPSKQKNLRTVEKTANSMKNVTQSDNAEKTLLVQKVRSRRRKKEISMSKKNLQQAVSQIVTQLSTVKHGFPNNKNSLEEVEIQPKLKEKSVQKARNVKEVVVDPISDTYLFGSLKAKKGGIHKKDKLDDCLENLKHQKNLNIVKEPIQQTTNSLQKKSGTLLGANLKQNEQFKLKEKSVQKAGNVKEIVVDPISDTYLFGANLKQNEQFNFEKTLKKNKDMKNSKRSQPQNQAQKSIKREAFNKSQSGLLPKITPDKQVQIGEQDKETKCEKKFKEKQFNFSEKFKSISQKQMINNAEQKKTKKDMQNILNEIQDNLEKKSRGSKPQSIVQKSIKENDYDRSQSGLTEKEKHDKCEKISKGTKPKNKASKPIKRKTAEASLTGLIEEIFRVKQVQFQRQDQNSYEKKSEDSEKFKSISQKQIQQMINNAEQKKTEEDKQNILNEIQDNLEKKSRGSKPQSIVQKSIKENDSDRSQSGLTEKEKHDKCEKISKGTKPENKASKPIKRKTAEASLTGLIEEIFRVKQVQFQNQNQDSYEKKSEDKQLNFKENLKNIENIAQEKIQQSINDQKNSLTLQDIIHNQNKENNQKMLKENQEPYMEISKGSKPGNTNSKLSKKRTAEDASLSGFIDKIFPVKQVIIQNQDQDNSENKSKDKYENFTQEPSQSGLIGRIVPINQVAIYNEKNCETNLKQSKPENATLDQNCVNNGKPEESFKAQISKTPLKQVYDDQSKQINCSDKSIEKSALKLNQQVNNTQEMRVETLKSGLIGHILPVSQVVIDVEDNKRDSCAKSLKRKREPIEIQAVQLENNVQKVKSVESELKKLKMSNLVKPTQLVTPEKVTICQSDTRITSHNCVNNISPLHQENSEQHQLHSSMDEMLNERWRKMKAKVEKSENKMRAQFIRCTEYVLTNEGTVKLTEEPMQTKKTDEIRQTSLIGKLKSLLKRRLTCHF